MSTRRFFRAAIPAAVALACSPAAFAADEASPPPGAASSPAVAPASQTVEVSGVRQPYRNLSATGATKTDALLKDLPQSVRVLGADLLQDAGVTRLGDALELGSGIARQSNLGGLWDSYAMRGFTGDPNFGSDYLVNGFNYSRGYNGLRDTANTATVEVLKGPASALYGRGEPGGTVNITTKKPLFQSANAVGLSIGSYNNLRSTVDLTGPISERLAYRVNAAQERADSYRDDVASERYLVSPSLIWLPSSDTTVSLEFELSKQRATFDRGVLAINGVLGLVPRSRFLGEPDDGKHTTETQGSQLFVQHALSDDWSLQGGLSYRESSIEGISTEGRFLRADQRTLVRQRRTRDNSARDLSGRIELLGKVATGSLVHNLLVGVDAYRFADNRRQFRVATATSIDIYAPMYGQVAPAMTLNTDTSEHQRSLGTYLQDQMDLSSQWKMLVGVRSDTYEQSLLNHRNAVLTEQSMHAASPRLGVVYQPTRQLSLYASVAKSFRPNSGVSRPVDGVSASFPAEKGRAYELGAKLDSADGKLSGTLALYKIAKNNVLTPDPVDPNNYAIAAGEVQSKGVELDLSGEVASALRLSAAYAFTDAKVTQDNNSFLVGRQTANVPRQSANLMLVKSLLLAGKTATVGGGLNHVGVREGAVAPLVAADNFKLPAYTSVKLTGSIDPSKQLHLALDIDNLFDKLYYTSAYSQMWVYPGNGRKFSLSANYKF